MSRVGPYFGAGNFHGQPTVGPSNLNPGNTFSYQVTQSANPTPAALPTATAVPRNVDTTAAISVPAQVMAQPARKRHECSICKMPGHNKATCPNAQRVDMAPAPAPAPVFAVPQPVHAVARAESHDSARSHTVSMSRETEDTAQNPPSDRTRSAVAGMLSLRERICGLPVADNETHEPPAHNDTAGHNEQPSHDEPAVIEEQPHQDRSDANAPIIIDGDEEDFMDIDEGNIGEDIIGTDTEVESDEEPSRRPKRQLHRTLRHSPRLRRSQRPCRRRRRRRRSSCPRCPSQRRPGY